MDQYEVIFLDDDEETVLDKQLVNKGDRVEYKGKTPEKAPENQIKYTFIGWTNEEKLESVQENIMLVAKYEQEVMMNPIEEAFYNATLDTAKQAKVNSTMQAGQKIVTQLRALEKDNRTAEQIVSDVLKNGQTEIGSQKDIERE